MAEPVRNPAAGGFPIAVGALAGAAIGFSMGEATLGLLIGGGLGVAIAVAIWILGRG